ncbi:MAG: TOBE domain-containing protein, partial [Comamonadaceae bacterium]|nr:TOBE domain-containing protein [Comamonadaceae bacterium]
SEVDAGAPAAAATIGLRPEDIALDAQAGVAAVVRSVEYLGADLVLACEIGSQSVLVRTSGQQRAAPGERVRLAWAPHQVHAFDAAGQRIH